MTITLGGVAISDNMYLDGVTESAQVAYQQERTVEGLSRLMVIPTPGGRVLTLRTQTLNGSTQGIWCQSVIDALKELGKVAIDYTLDHHGDIYTVKIVNTADFTPLFQYEPVSPNKKYTGKITTIEV